MTRRAHSTTQVGRAGDSLDLQLREALAPRRDRAAFTAAVLEQIGNDGQLGNDGAAEATGIAVGEDAVRGPREMPGWLRAAAGVMPPGLLGPAAVTKLAAVKAGGKLVPWLWLALPFAALLGIAATAFWGLRSLGTLDGSRSGQARRRLRQQLQWFGEGHAWRFSALLLVVTVAMVSAPELALLLLIGSMLVFMLGTVRALTRIGLASRVHVGLSSAGLLAWGGLQVHALGGILRMRQSGDVGGMSLVMLGAALFCALAAFEFRPERLRRHVANSPVGMRLRPFEWAVVSVCLLPMVGLLGWALFWLPLQESIGKPVLGNVQARLDDTLGGEPTLYHQRQLADAVTQAGLEVDLQRLASGYRQELEERLPNVSMLWAAAYAGLVGDGELARLREAHQDAILFGHQPWQDFVRSSDSTLAVATDPTLDEADRLRAARTLVAALPTGRRFAALADLRQTWWLCQRLGQPAVFLKRREAVHELLRQHWLPAIQPGGEPVFTGGLEPEAGEPHRPYHAAADFHAALLMTVVGVPDGIDVDAFRDYLRVEVERGSRFDPPQTDAVFRACAMHLLDLEFGAPPPLSPIERLVDSSALLALLVLAVFCVVLTLRAPAGDVDGERVAVSAD